MRTLATDIINLKMHNQITIEMETCNKKHHSTKKTMSLQQKDSQRTMIPVTESQRRDVYQCSRMHRGNYQNKKINNNTQKTNISSTQMLLSSRIAIYNSLKVYKHSK